jgi:hypothetical protein
MSNSMVGVLMPKNPMDIYVDVILHGVLKSKDEG